MKNKTWLKQPEHPVRQFRPVKPSSIWPGDIVVAADLLLVTKVNAQRATVTLAGIYYELATEVDVILTPDQAGLSYPCVIFTRFTKTIPCYQITRLLGAVTSDTLFQIESLGCSDETKNITLHRGMPLLPCGVDSRYTHLEDLAYAFLKT